MAVIMICVVLLCVMTFCHTLKRRLTTGIKRKLYRKSRDGIGFLASGAIAFAFFYYRSNVFLLENDDVKTVLFLAGFWMLIGLINILGYFLICTLDDEG